MSSTRGPVGPEHGSLAERGAQIMAEHWRPQGFTCPNSTTYPWLWLWDSCFHSIIWGHLGDPERALTELATALSSQDADGFVPHLAYLNGYDGHSEFWGRSGASSITQPPIYGHTVAELTRLGIEVPEELRVKATAGLNYLLRERRRSSSGLIELVHPWESGCDHSPRWDDLMAPGNVDSALDPYDKDIWFHRKGELLGSIARSASGAPLWNPEFPVGSVAFSAIVAFCAEELASVTHDEDLARMGRELGAELQGRWDSELRTWVDDGPTASGSGRIRTLEALLPLLVETDTSAIGEVVAELTDPAAFGGEFGLRQVHPGESRFAAGSYWRGPTWPQLDYLLWIALKRAGNSEVASTVAERTGHGAERSGFAEYWDSDSGEPGGAMPQSWAVLAICMKDFI
ncbi:MAG TPA: hypothetical protein VL068_14580 [Microthrixaceae bacterium]|nr:hypothetical protein [Microthrixaceae bacterium]